MKWYSVEISKEYYEGIENFKNFLRSAGIVYESSEAYCNIHFSILLDSEDVSGVNNAIDSIIYGE